MYEKTDKSIYRQEQHFMLPTMMVAAKTFFKKTSYYGQRGVALVREAWLSLQWVGIAVLPAASLDFLLNDNLVAGENNQC